MTKTYAKKDHSELLAQLEQGITTLTSSDTWTEYLAFQAKFHHYSASNAQLIMMQSGGYATRVAGFHKWLELGRHVRKGETGLYILAPLVYTTKDEETGEKTGSAIRGFRYVCVFDIAQTEGEDLPQVATLLEGDDPNGLFADLAEIAVDLGFSVHVDTISEPGVNGYCDHAAKLIKISETLSPAAKVKTLAHELSHAILHTDDGREGLERGILELEAESSAFVVCAALGVDSGAYSFGYVATWAGGGEVALKAIRASQERIHKASALILKYLEALTSDRKEPVNA